ncbi:MAG: hypothetical protein QM713_14025 [Arachnia sp.]
MIKRLGLWAFVVAGLAVAVWAAASWAAPTVSCRGVEMGPGDVCRQTGFTGDESGKIRTYEESLNSLRQQAPFGVLAGLGVSAFGVVLVRRDAKAS